MKVILSLRAEKDIRKLPKFDQIAIAQKIRSLCRSYVTGEEKLSGYRDVYRTRVGMYRIVYYKIKETITIILIHHRRDVYLLLKKLLD